MRLRHAVALLPVAALALVQAALGVDPPHWTGVAFTMDCSTQCHTLHHAAGGGLTANASNINLCMSCHNPAGSASGLALSNADRAVPGVLGTSHAFDAPAVEAEYGAQAPLNVPMSLRLPGGNVVCSTCHDQHDSTPADPATADPGTPRISTAKKVTSLGSTGTVASGGTFSGAAGIWYLIEVQAGNTFRWSKDNGVSWMAQGVAMTRGTPVTLAPNGNGATVLFSASGAFIIGERWEFSGSYPFLRAKLDRGDNATGDQFCRDCHRDWVMDHTGTRTYTGTYRSHPVGVALNANGEAYDRSVPLDGNGAAQGGAGIDANPSNDLKLDSAGRLQCITCHGVHHADGNTQTVDGP